MGKKQILAAVLLAVMVISSACGRTEAHPEDVPQAREADRTIYYFHETVCASCDREGEFYEELSGKLGDMGHLPEGWRVRCVNTFQEDEALWRRLCGEMGIPEEEMRLPMLLTPAGAAVGKEEISAGMRDLIRESCGIDGAVWYYQRPDCRDCQRVSEAIREAAAAHAQCLFVEIDVTDAEEKAAFKELLQSLGIPPEEWEVPFLYNGSDWLSGDADIEAGLETIFPDGGQG